MNQGVNQGKKKPIDMYVKIKTIIIKNKHKNNLNGRKGDTIGMLFRDTNTDITLKAK